jgi:helix-turn-helix protein
MSWTATAYVKPLRFAPNGTALTRSEKFLLFILADYHNEEQHAAWPSGATLARDALMTLRHVRSLLAGLKASGILCTSQRLTAKGDFDTTVYHFHAIDCPGPHESGGSEIASLPPLKGPHSQAGVVLPATLPSDVGNTTLVLPTTLPVVKFPTSHNKDEPLVGTARGTTKEPTHTHAASAPPAEQLGLQLGGSVCVKSKFTFSERRAYADNQQPRLGNGWLHQSGDGRFDELIEEWQHSQQPESSRPEVDTSNCPDCAGTGYWYPQGVERGVARCRHARLFEEPDTDTRGSPD